MLHDLGKIGLPITLLQSQDDLTPEQLAEYRQHAIYGERILSPFLSFSNVRALVRHHHERRDGSGYPDGLKGDEISLGSHILNICDAIDAMCSNRPYRAALTIEQCLAEVVRFRGTQFDASVADVFQAMVRENDFEIIEQSDGAALKIQEILRKAAEDSARKRARLLQRDRTQAA